MNKVLLQVLVIAQVALLLKFTVPQIHNTAVRHTVIRFEYQNVQHPSTYIYKRRHGYLTVPTSGCLDHLEDREEHLKCSKVDH